MATSAREVRIVTPSDDILVRLDDDVFADLLSPIIELEEDVSELVLTSTVGEIFEAEWNAAKRLIDWMAEYRKEYGDSIYHTINMRVYLGYGSIELEDKMGLPNVSLRQVARIRYILNLPQGWEECVYVDDSSDESIEHLSIVGKALFDSKSENYYGIVSNWLPLMHNLQKLHEGLHDTMPRRELLVWTTAIPAVLRNATLR